MKKTLLLSLLMRVSSLANADFSFNVNGTHYASGSTVPIFSQTTIGLYNDTQFTGVPDIRWIAFENGVAIPGSGTVGTVLPGTWEITEVDTDDGWEWWGIENTEPHGGDTLGGGWEIRENKDPVDLLPAAVKNQMLERTKDWQGVLE
jgi:hypothetical protein